MVTWSEGGISQDYTGDLSELVTDNGLQSSYGTAGPTLPTSLSPIGDLLDERELTHGRFSDVSMAASRIKTAIEDGVMWHTLTFAQREALHMIASKIGRIVSGDPRHKDHWVDIGGYAKLIADGL